MDNGFGVSLPLSSQHAPRGPRADQSRADQRGIAFDVRSPLRKIFKKATLVSVAFKDREKTEDLVYFNKSY